MANVYFENFEQRLDVHATGTILGCTSFSTHPSRKSRPNFLEFRLGSQQEKWMNLIAVCDTKS
uniref:Uncharacterized protein n=1 Tax=Megaselia scalaris TaxID=36166 RepID=T1GCN5_MEGSC